ncbi:MAG: TlpA family protein disulfide reductase [Bacteroidota bacterium]|nr:TlpA family protein disulfide reductase [Bacteroidota bacterium]
MKPKIQLLFLFCMIVVAATAQKDTSTTFNSGIATPPLGIRAKSDTSAKFNIGDAAPPLRVREWVKGMPVKNFENAKVYVVDFWATWCGPCMAAMPHLSGLARKYRGKVSFSAIDVYESRGTKIASIAQLKALVEQMGRRMDFNVAAEDTNFTVHDWLDACGVNSIPTTFVIDRQGTVAWIGRPNSLDPVLRKIVNGTWQIQDIQHLSAKRIFNDRWEKADEAVADKVRSYQDRWSNHLDHLGNPDSTLLVIDEMVKKEPDLKYAPWMVSYTFSALLLTDQHQAYEYGKQAMATSTYQHPAYDMIIAEIGGALHEINMRPEIYRLCAECYQAEIDWLLHSAYTNLADMAKKYREMAGWYRLAGGKTKALEAERKSIKFEEKSTR